MQDFVKTLGEPMLPGAPRARRDPCAIPAPLSWLPSAGFSAHKILLLCSVALGRFRGMPKHTGLDEGPQGQHSLMLSQECRPATHRPARIPVWFCPFPAARRGPSAPCRPQAAARGAGEERHIQRGALCPGGDRLVPPQPLPPLVALRHQLPAPADVGGGGDGEVHEVGEPEGSGSARAFPAPEPDQAPCGAVPSRIYKYQAHGYAFSSLEELLRSLGGDAFVNMTQRSVAESLLEVGVTQRFVDDVIAAVLRSSYGQSVLVPAFAGAMSLAGAQGSTWAVEGGNKLVCSGLLKLTKANVIPARVTGISLHSSEGRALYQVHYEGSEGQGSAFYDMVVVTTPLHPSRSNFTFENFEPPIANFPSAFQPSVTSVVHGYLNSSYFGFPDPKLFPFASILTTDTPDLFFNAMDNICPVNISVAFRRKQPQEAAVWRVLSQQPLDKQQLKTLFRSYYSVQVTEWQSYPRYDSTKSLPPIVLHDSLFYLSGVEWVASSMEMIAVAAKNVALLAYNRWYQDLEKIDQKDLMHKVKTEL
uniref:Prenylcysteine oxidase 1 like n=1 Tax=Cairina moschata TaxID=8855 RepID=A0A8C3BQV4_CAIMO